jgi:AcrR family transcriptional regulator
VSTGRSYQSSLREQQAQETKRRIRETARELFASQGFAETTITQIAENAGVSPQTVYAVFRSKGNIVGAMLELLEESAGIEGWVARMMSEDDSRKQLRLFVAMIRTMFENGAPILRAAIAARSDPEVAAMGERGDQRRREGTEQLCHLWVAKGDLRGDLDEADAAQRLWLLTSVEQFLMATEELGWLPDRYETWLGNLLERELFDPFPA